jgi:hypothetical protein
MVYQNTFRFPEKAAHEVETPKSSFISEAEVCQMGPKSEGCLPKKIVVMITYVKVWSKYKGQNLVGP